MEWFGWIAFIIALCYAGYPGRVKRAERRIKKLEKNLGGGTKMSEMINSLKGQKCIIEFSDSIESFLDDKVSCTIVDTDSDWVKISYTQKKKKEEERTVSKIIRIENIESIELCE